MQKLKIILFQMPILSNIPKISTLNSISNTKLELLVFRLKNLLFYHQKLFFKLVNFR